MDPAQQQMKSQEPLLEIKGISKRYGSKVVAEDIHLTIGRGEFFTFLGASGSGKSTTLRIVAGLEIPDGGSVRILGREMSDIPPWKRDLGMVFQQYAVFPHMNVAQNIAYGLKVRRMPRQKIAQRVRELIALVGLEGMENKSVTLLSGGEQQRVALARALAPEPLVLLLDEPLSALDEKIRREMQSELKRIQRSTGTTFLYVTHDQEEALTMSDRIMVLHNGHAAQIGTPEEIFLRPRNAYVAKFFRGNNVFDASLEKGAGRGARLQFCGAEFILPDHPAGGANGPVEVAVRSENLLIGTDIDDRCVRLTAKVENWIFRGSNADWNLLFQDGQTATATTSRRATPPADGTVTLGIRPDDIVLLTPQTSHGAA